MPLKDTVVVVEILVKSTFAPLAGREAGVVPFEVACLAWHEPDSIQEVNVTGGD